MNMNEISRRELEEALDSGHLQFQQDNGKWIKVRRNGKTQTWKTRPSEFRIPLKAGLYMYGEITHRDIGREDSRFRINERP